MSALPKPPPNISYASDIQERWKIVTEKFLAGKSVSFELGQIESTIALGQDQLRGKILSKELDWQYDLTHAEIIHRSNLAWMESVSIQLSGYVEYWRRNASNLNDFGIRLGHAGIQYSFFAHGGIGLASFSALNNEPLKYSAIIGIVGAIFGLILLTLGCVVIIETAPYAASHIESRILSKFTYKKHRALSRVFDKKISPKLRLSNGLIYGSITWLIFYAFVALVVFVEMQ